jgi:hypothetical protein
LIGRKHGQPLIKWASEANTAGLVGHFTAGGELP